MLVRLCLSLGAVALVGAPPSWTSISRDDLSTTSSPALARTPDGTLHVLWVAREKGRETLRQAVISPEGDRVAPASPVVEGWASLSTPALVVGREGLRAFFAGMRTTESSDPLGHGALASASSRDGARWMLEAKPRSKDNNVSASSGLGALLRPDGSPVVTWAVAPGTVASLGAQVASPTTVLQTACCGYWAVPAIDARSGEVYAGWFSNDSQTLGFRIQPLAPAGPAQVVPQSLSMANGRPDFVMPGQHAGLSGRIGEGGIFAAYGSGYPVATKALFWRVGGDAPLKVAEARVENVGLAPAPEGRMWVFWKSGRATFAARSNRAATRFGAAVQGAAPAGCESIWRLAGEASRGPLDLVALMAVAGQRTNHWHARLLPRLEAAVGAPKAGQVTVTVTDAGDPMAGALVRLGSAEARTDAAGQAMLKAAKGAKGTVSLDGYQEAAISVR